MEINNNDAPWIMLDTNLIIKACIDVDITESEKALFRAIESGKINAIISPINYGEIKYNPVLSSLLKDGSIRRNFYNEKAGTGQLLVFNSPNLFGVNGNFSHLLELANAYSYDKNRQKRVPYYEFNDRLIAALARILNIPLVTADSHLLEKGVREHVRKVNKRFGYDGQYSFPLSANEYLQNQAYFREHRDYSSGPDFRFVPLTRLGALSSAVRSTEAVVENYREQIDNSAYEQLNVLFNTEILSEENSESLKSLEKRLAKCFDADAEFKSDEDRFKKAQIAATSYMFMLTAMVFYVMEYVSQVKYQQNSQEKFDRERLLDIEKSLSNFGFSFVYDGDSLVSLDYKGLSFSLCQRGQYKNFYPVKDILGKSLDESYKINCMVDIDKLEPATSMALIPFGLLRTGLRTEISKKYIWGLRRKKNGVNLISNEQLVELVANSSISGVTEFDTEDFGKEPAKANACKTLAYLNRIEVKDRGAFSFE